MLYNFSFLARYGISFHFCIDCFDLHWGSDNWIVNLAMILIVVSSLLDLHGRLAGDKRSAEVRGYQVLHFAALSSKS